MKASVSNLHVEASVSNICMLQIQFLSGILKLQFPISAHMKASVSNLPIVKASVSNLHVEHGHGLCERLADVHAGVEAQPTHKTALS
jgi:hypothetical protein